MLPDAMKAFHSVYFGRPGLIQTADDKFHINNSQHVQTIT